MKVTVSIALVGLAAHGWAAGAMGHNALGAITANRILNGTYSAPEELKEALQNPQAKQAFIGGSIGPDLFPGRTHRGNQSQFAQQMLQNARQQMQSANSPESKAQATEALAFAYGWFAHVAADLNVHPKVNSIVGDTYDYNNAGEKTTHAALEAQLYAYLKRVAGADEKFDARFPSEFIAEQLGLDAADVKQAISRIRIIAAGEIAAANQVTLTDKQLKDAWSESVREGMNDTRKFLNTPSSFENWDLDCGKISTDDFEWLRKAWMQINDGKLPSNWGRNYMELWEKVKNLPPGDRFAALERLASSGSGANKTTTSNSNIPWHAKDLAAKGHLLVVKVERDWVFPSRMRYPDLNVQWTGAKFSLRGTFEDWPYTKTLEIEGEMGEGEIVWLTLKMSLTMKDNPGFSSASELQVKHVPYVQGGLWDEYVDDVTFAAFTEKQAPAFSGSFKGGNGYDFVWDKSTMKKASEGRTLYPIVTIRFRDKKYR